MKSLLWVLLLAVGWGSITGIHTRNVAVQAATQAYGQGRYAEAVRQYQRALAVTAHPDEALLLNLAHAAGQAGQLALARSTYSRLLTSARPVLRSVAQQQLATLLARRGEYAQAARLLRQALLTNPTNATARYNYEAVMRYLARRPNPALPPPPPPPAGSPPPRETAPQPRSKAGNQQEGQLPDPARSDASQPAQSRPDQEGQPREDGKGGNGPGATPDFQLGEGARQQVAQGQEPGTVRGLGPAAAASNAAPGRRPGTDNASAEATQLQTQRARLQAMQLSPAQARQLLEALRASEQQYLQQLPRKATRPAPKGRPAW